jgi:hypothetical protein
VILYGEPQSGRLDPAPIMSVSGEPLDGDRDGLPGGNFTFRLVVVPE